MSEPVGTDSVTSVEHDGRVLSGVGVSAESLQAVMDERTPDVETPEHVAASDPASPSPTDAQPAKPESRGARRFADLTREREEARREAAAAKAAREAIEKERDEWRTRFDALMKEPRAQGAPQAEPAAQPAQPAAAKNTDEFSFPGFDEWFEQNPTGDWNAWDRQRLMAFAKWQENSFDARIRTRIEADRASRSRQDRQAAIGAKGRTVFPDFDAVVGSGAGASVDIAHERWDYIDALPNAHAIIYAIARDADLAKQVASCPPFELSGILSRLAPESSGASTASPGTSGVVTPPPPMQPVGSGSKTTTPTAADLIAKGGTDYDKSGYRQKRAAERGRVVGRR